LYASACGEGRALRAQRPRGPGGREAWGGSPDWARPWRAQGQAVQVRAPQDGTPSITTHTKERRAAAARAAALTRPRRRLVPRNAVEPPARQAWPRGRARLRGARPALVQARRGRWAAEGLVWPQGVTAWRHAVREQRDAAPAPLTSLSQERLAKRLDAGGQGASARADDAAQRAARAPSPLAGPRRLPLPGLGPSTAPALSAALSAVGVGTPGRHWTAWWGRGPPPHATGGQTRW
jgi:transposase